MKAIALGQLSAINSWNKVFPFDMVATPVSILDTNGRMKKKESAEGNPPPKSFSSSGSLFKKEIEEKDKMIADLQLTLKQQSEQIGRLTDQVERLTAYLTGKEKVPVPPVVPPPAKSVGGTSLGEKTKKDTRVTFTDTSNSKDPNKDPQECYAKGCKNYHKLGWKYCGLHLNTSSDRAKLPSAKDKVQEAPTPKPATTKKVVKATPPVSKGKEIKKEGNEVVRRISPLQYEGLRKAFELPPLPEDFITLPKKDQREARKLSDVPRWALLAVEKYGEEAYDDIVAGRATPDDYVERSSPKTRADRIKEWSEIRAKFKGVPLVYNPIGKDQKALLSAYKRIEKICQERKFEPFLPKMGYRTPKSKSVGGSPPKTPKSVPGTPRKISQKEKKTLDDFTKEELKAFLKKLF
jgi:hypothetical protein